jgi:hypothetical protein
MSIRTATLIAFTAVLTLGDEVRAQDAAPSITRTVNRTHTVVQEDGRAIVRLDARQGDGFAVVTGPAFTEGTIELEARGEDVQGQSFVGVAWNVQNDSTY